MVGSISIRMLSNIFLGRVMFAPARNSATTTSSNEEMKASNPAETRLGRSSGRVTRESVRLAPSPSAACSSERSKSRRPATITSTTKGSASTVWAMTSPYQVPISFSLANRP